MHPLADGVNVVGLLLGQIGDADAAGQIDEGDVCAGLALQAHGKLKEDARKLGVVVVGDGVAGKECVDTKVLGTLGLERASWNRPPGLKRQLTVLGMGPATCSKNSMWLMSSKLTMAPSLSASSKSAAGVSLDENMMSCPVMPSERAIMSSV